MEALLFVIGCVILGFIGGWLKVRRNKGPPWWESGMFCRKCRTFSNACWCLKCTIPPDDSPKKVQPLPPCIFNSNGFLVLDVNAPRAMEALRKLLWPNKESK